VVPKWTRERKATRSFMKNSGGFGGAGGDASILGVTMGAVAAGLHAVHVGFVHVHRGPKEAVTPTCMMN
jgi:hypothetical protein